MTSENILEHFLQLSPHLKCKNNASGLDIYHIHFPNDIMQGNWLGTKALARIEQIELNDYNIKEIKPNAFNLNVFSNVSYLQIYNLPLQNLQEGVFKNLPNLERLGFRNVSIKVFDLVAS